MRPLRVLFVLSWCAACFVMSTGTAAAQSFTPGASGIGDPYFPLEGNGGYDVQHYDLSFSYDPATDELDAVNKITATANQGLSRFDLDLQQLTVDSVDVNGHHATFTRDGQELVITPSAGIPNGSTFTVIVRYGGVPRRSWARRSCSARRTASSTRATGPSWATSRTRPRRGSR
jgi:hypothetical protein